MKEKFWKKFNESEYANEVVDFESDCMPTIGDKVYMSGGLLITLDSILIITRKGIFEFKIYELDDIKLHNKFLEKGIILHSWKKEINIKINFNDERDRKHFFNQFKETFERLKIEFDNENKDIQNHNYNEEKTSEKVHSNKLPYEELKQLKELLDMGILTQEEFDKKKAQLLDNYL